MSTRNTGSCLAQGQAIGTAAALSVKDNCAIREIDIRKLQTILREQGAFLGD